MSPSPSRAGSWGRLRLVALWSLLAVLVLLARPRPLDLLVGLPFVAAGELLRSWAAGYLVKTRRLVTDGPYRFTRNPLYLGRLAIFTGLALMARLPHGLHWIALGAGHVVFFAYYLPRKERVEPERLRRTHGERYETYRRAVPALLPGRRPYPRRGQRWSPELFYRNREHWMVLALVLIVATLALRAGSG